MDEVIIGKTLGGLGYKDFTFNLNAKQFRHAWLLGKTGTGKSTLLRHIIASVIRNPNCALFVIDPHGDLINDAFNYIPEWRLKDLVYLNPENDKIPDIGFLDYPDKAKALRIAMTLYEAHSGADGWGKRSASILRNVTRAVLERFSHPTILHVYLMLTDDGFARSVLKRSRDFRTKRFYSFWWSMTATKRAEAFSAPLNKIEELVEDGLLEFFCQEKSLNFRKLMDEQKIVFCRVPKSYLEERDARILGSAIMMKIKTDAGRRKRRKKAVFIVADEFHNFTDGFDVSTSFGESRKNGTHYVVADQTEEQLGKNAAIIKGNVSHIFAFRMNAADAEDIEKNIGSEDFTFRELVMMPNFTFRALTMNDGEPTASEKVDLYEHPPIFGDEVPARKAVAWATENTGTPRTEIHKRIDKEIKLLTTPPRKAKKKKAVA